jgi:glucosamine--fructose-6-phosphate aminotransferase (isomerizing)
LNIGNAPRHPDIMGPVTQFEREIREQPEALRMLFAQAQDALERAAAAIARYAPTFVVIAARGSSDNAARYAQYLFGEALGWTVALAAPSLFSIYDARPSLKGALVLGISQSGQSPDIVSVLEEGQRQGALTVALTNAVTSPLSDAAAHTIPLSAGTEHAVAASKSYLNQLGALAWLCVTLQNNPQRKASLMEMPERVARALDVAMDARQLAQELVSRQQVLVLGRGFNFGTAHEIALKLKETSRIHAEPHSTADFLHGPMASVDAGTSVIAIAPSSRVFRQTMELLERLEPLGVQRIVLSDEAEAGTRAEVLLQLPSGIPEWLSPLTSVVPGQLLALELALARGLNPDSPRGLTKVTKTL